MTIEELQKVQENAKALKVKNAELEQENKYVSNENLALNKKNEILKKDVTGLQDKKKELLKEIVGLEKDKKAQLTAISDQMAELSAKKADIDSRILQNNEELSSIKTKSDQLVKDRATFKQEKLEVMEKQRDLTSTIISYNEKKKEYEGLEVDKKKVIADLEKKGKALDVKHAEVSVLVEKSKISLAEKDQKNAELQENINILKAQKSTLVSKACELERLKEENEEIRIALQGAIKEAEAEKKSSQAMKAALDVQKNEVKIRELRVTKRETEVGLEKELESLTNNA